MTRGGKMTQEPLYPEGHPKRIEQDSQRNNIDAPSPSKRKKTKNDRTLHASSEPVDDDINTIFTPTVPAAIHTGPITRARARQLNYQVLLFLGNDSKFMRI